MAADVPRDAKGPEIHDHRPDPPGSVPSRLQTWIILGISGVIALIVLYSQRTNVARPSRPLVESTTPRPADQSVAAEVRSRIDAHERLLADARQRLAERQTQLDQMSEAPRPSSTSSSRGEAAGAMRQEQQRRERESLFANQLVYTERARPDQTGAATAKDSRGVATDPALLAALALATQGRSSQTATATAPTPSMAEVNTSPGSPNATRPSAPTWTPPIDDHGPWHRLSEGTILEGTLSTELDGEFAGPVLARVSTPVYSRTGQVLVIPAGSTLVGEARAVSTADQQRLAVTFHRLEFENGSAVTLDRVPALSQQGATGLHDLVDHHYWSVFGSAIAVAGIAGLANAGFGTGQHGDLIVLRGGAPEQAADRVLDRYLNQRPSIRIRAGHRLRVLLTADLDLPAYPTARETIANDAQHPQSSFDEHQEG